MGACTKPQAFAMLDQFYAQGGNFIDTANAYQNEESENWIGEWMSLRGSRDEMVIVRHPLTVKHPPPPTPVTHTPNDQYLNTTPPRQPNTLALSRTINAR